MSWVGSVIWRTFGGHHGEIKSYEIQDETSYATILREALKIQASSKGHKCLALINKLQEAMGFPYNYLDPSVAVHHEPAGGFTCWIRYMSFCCALNGRSARDPITETMYREEGNTVILEVCPHAKILAFNMGPHPYLVPYCLFVDNRTREIVLCLGGAADREVCRVVIEQASICQFELHQGLMDCAQFIIRTLQADIESILRKLPLYRLMCIGHSAGGAIAQIAAILLRSSLGPESNRIRGIGFGAPPIFEHRRARHDEFLTSVINGKDLIPRLSSGSVSATVSKLEVVGAHYIELEEEFCPTEPIRCCGEPRLVGLEGEIVARLAGCGRILTSEHVRQAWHKLDSNTKYSDILKPAGAVFQILSEDEWLQIGGLQPDNGLLKRKSVCVQVDDLWIEDFARTIYTGPAALEDHSHSNYLQVLQGLDPASGCYYISTHYYSSPVIYSP